MAFAVHHHHRPFHHGHFHAPRPHCHRQAPFVATYHRPCHAPRPFFQRHFPFFAPRPAYCAPNHPRNVTVFTGRSSAATIALTVLAVIGLAALLLLLL